MSKKFKDQPEKKYKRTPQLQEKADAWLDEKVNQPLASKGFGGLGAGISAAGSTLVSLFDSEDDEMAMTVPGLGSLGAKAGKKIKDLTKEQYLKRLDDEIAAAKKSAEGPTLNYSDLKMPSKSKTKKNPGLKYEQDVDAVGTRQNWRANPKKK